MSEQPKYWKKLTSVVKRREQKPPIYVKVWVLVELLMTDEYDRARIVYAGRPHNNMNCHWIDLDTLEPVADEEVQEFTLRVLAGENCPHVIYEQR